MSCSFLMPPRSVSTTGSVWLTVWGMEVGNCCVLDVGKGVRRMTVGRRESGGVNARAVLRLLTCSCLDIEALCLGRPAFRGVAGALMQRRCRTFTAGCARRARRRNCSDLSLAAAGKNNNYLCAVAVAAEATRRACGMLDDAQRFPKRPQHLTNANCCLRFTWVRAR